MLVDELTTEQRRIEVARQLVAVGRSLRAFNFGGEQYLSQVTSETMQEAECAFSDGVDAERARASAHYDRPEHLARVVAYLVRRKAPKFAANPQQWIETRRELRA
jgi:hypothetical protein